jgi:hypothetical protein
LKLQNNYGTGGTDKPVSNYGAQMLINRRRYETIPATDFRKKCFVDFAIEELPGNAAIE